MHDLIKNLLNGKRDISSLPKTITAKLGDIFKCLDEIPVIDLLYLINKKTAQKICSSIDKIVALAHVSQSMGDYFARDDSLDPALSIVCQGLRGNINFEQILRSRGGTFQSLAAAYWHLKSEVDHDLTGRIHASTGGGDRRRSANRNQNRPPTQKKNVCWYFQRSGQCSRRNCGFVHKCERCGSKNHGERQCRSK